MFAHTKIVVLCLIEFYIKNFVLFSHHHDNNMKKDTKRLHFGICYLVFECIIYKSDI